MKQKKLEMKAPRELRSLEKRLHSQYNSHTHSFLLDLNLTSSGVICEVEDSLATSDPRRHEFDDSKQLGQRTLGYAPNVSVMRGSPIVSRAEFGRPHK